MSFPSEVYDSIFSFLPATEFAAATDFLSDLDETTRNNILSYLSPDVLLSLQNRDVQSHVNSFVFNFHGEVARLLAVINGHARRTVLALSDREMRDLEVRRLRPRLFRPISMPAFLDRAIRLYNESVARVYNQTGFMPPHNHIQILHDSWFGLWRFFELWGYNNNVGLGGVPEVRELCLLTMRWFARTGGTRYLYAQ